MMFTNLPNELQQEMATYLDTQSLCLFASTSKRSCGNARSELIKRRQKLFHSPNISLIASVDASFCYTPKAIYVCGNHTFGWLGLGPTNNCSTFTPVTTLPPGTIQQVVAGRGYTLMLTDQGLYACGYNGFGQLGLGHQNNCLTSTLVTAFQPGTIKQVAAGLLHTLVLTDNGLYACGINDSGQLGLSQVDGCSIFTPVTAFQPGTIQQVAAGIQHTLVLTDNGLYACGNNLFGQLGLGHTNKCSTFVRVPESIPPLQQLFKQLHQLDRLISLSEEPKGQDSLCTQQLRP